MMEQDEFRALALTFPEAVESGHFDTVDFRVRNKIFATLRAADGRAVLKLSPDEQQLVMATSSGMFEPIKGSWGLKGWTQVALDRADAETIRHAMAMALSRAEEACCPMMHRFAWTHYTTLAVWMLGFGLCQMLRHRVSALCGWLAIQWRKISKPVLNQDFRRYPWLAR